MNHSVNYINRIHNISNAICVEMPEDIDKKLRGFDFSIHASFVDKILSYCAVIDKLYPIRLNPLCAFRLYGDSGSGKTALARYIALRLNRPLIHLNCYVIKDEPLYVITTLLNILSSSNNEWPSVVLFDSFRQLGVSGGAMLSFSKFLHDYKSRSVLFFEDSNDYLDNFSYEITSYIVTGINREQIRTHLDCFPNVQYTMDDIDRFLDTHEHNNIGKFLNRLDQKIVQGIATNGTFKLSDQIK